MKVSSKILYFLLCALICSPSPAFAKGGGPQGGWEFVLVPLLVPPISIFSVWLAWRLGYLLIKLWAVINLAMAGLIVIAVVPLLVGFPISDDSVLVPLAFILGFFSMSSVPALVVVQVILFVLRHQRVSKDRRSEGVGATNRYNR